jgi:TonB family protein
MRFAPIPETSVLFSIWDTRFQDYQVFVAETSRPKVRTSFSQEATHPVVNISWDDAKAFCDWITAREHRARTLAANQQYRLPTNMEWDCAVGLNCDIDMHEFPWGDRWPPPKGSGNYAPQLGVDSYEHTSPVGIYAPNRYGIYDLGGNVLTWCDDWADASKLAHLQRGSSWDSLLPGSIKVDGHSSGVPRETSPVVGFRCVLTSLTRNGRTWQTWMGEFVKHFVEDNQLHDVDANLAYYGNLVNYFDNGEKDQTYIRSDIEKYNERWPTRHDEIVGGNVGLQERVSDTEYIAEYKLNYYAESIPRGAWSKGQFELTLDVMTFDGVPKIVGIKEKVLHQERGNLNPVANNSPWPSATVSAADSTGANQSDTTPPGGNAGRSVTPQSKKTDNPILYKLQPKYPASVKRLRIEGSGIFRLRFDGSGAVRSVQTLESTGNQLLDAAAIDALKHWLVVPGTETLSVPVTFSLPQ